MEGVSRRGTGESNVEVLGAAAISRGISDAVDAVEPVSSCEISTSVVSDSTGRETLDPATSASVSLLS